MNASKMHHRFQNYWPQYKRSDMQSVCKFICDSIGVKKTGNQIKFCMDNWGKVCNFLVQWDGK